MEKRTYCASSQNLKSSSLYKGRMQLLSNDMRFSESIIIAVDILSGQISDANEAATNFYGYSFEKLLSMKTYDITKLPYFVVMKKRMEAAQKISTIFIFPHILADGTVTDVEVRSFPVNIDGRRYLFSEIIEISASNKAML